MTKDQVIRAWKDEDYRLGLSESELSVLPQNPAGLVELSEDEIHEARGNITVAIVIAISFEALTLMYSCHTCPITLDGGGTCRMLTAGCCQ